VRALEGSRPLEAPWFWLECHAYKRLLDIVRLGAGGGAGVDPFASQKREALSAAAPALRWQCGSKPKRYTGGSRHA
jgi:hypothetical protein